MYDRVYSADPPRSWEIAALRMNELPGPNPEDYTDWNVGYQALAKTRYNAVMRLWEGEGMREFEATARRRLAKLRGGPQQKGGL